MVGNQYAEGWLSSLLSGDDTLHLVHSLRVTNSHGGVQLVAGPYAGLNTEGVTWRLHLLKKKALLTNPKINA